MSNARYVDTRIGTQGDGNTLPGAFTPWGMASVCPHTDRPYGQFSDTNTIYGFGHVHLSGVGGSCLGGVIVAAAMGRPGLDRQAYATPICDERAGVGVYRARLQRWMIDAAVTATPRTGLTRFTFTAGDASVFLDLSHGHSPRKGGGIRRLSETEVEGWKEDGHFCGTGLSHRVYFAARLCAPVKAALELWADNASVTADAVESENVGAIWRFGARANDTVFVQVGISYVSAANAWLNLHSEQAIPDFDAIVRNADKAWDDVLGRIQVEGGSDSDRTIFYTALYHACLHPNLFQDVNGEYRAYSSHQVRRVQGRNRYTVYSLWDTCRSLFPLYAILFPERLSEMVETMVDMYREGGCLPKWELCGNETYIMPGDPALPAIVDAYARGVRNFDVVTAYEAMRHNADALDANGHSNTRPGLAEYLKYGFVPHDLACKRGPIWTTAMKGSVSCTLEYALADSCLARMAAMCGHQADADRYHQRAAGWRHLFDPATGFVRPRNADGRWVEPFGPAQVGGGTWDKRSAPGFVEGNAWHYTFYVPHAIPELVTAMGGPAPFARKLQTCFDDGHYDGTNEPDMAYPFLFNHAAGEEWRTQKTVRECIRRYWHTGRDGIPGNDDCGTLSAWVVFAMLGLYPDCPGCPLYQISAPVFPRTEMRTATGKSFAIHASATSDAAWRITHLHLNGSPWLSHELPHDCIADGGKFSLALQ